VFLEKLLSSGKPIVKKLESQIIEKSMRASKPKTINKIAKTGYV